MAKTRLNANNTIDTLTQDELYETLTKQTVSFFQELSRGFTTARFESSGLVDQTDALVLPPTSQRQIGPQDGFAWTIRRISVYGLATGDVLRVYRNSANPLNFIDQLTDTSPVVKFDKGFILRGGENLVVAGADLDATEVFLTGEALETSELDLYKQLG